MGVAALAVRLSSPVDLALALSRVEAAPDRDPGVLRVMTFNIAHGRELAYNQALLRRNTIPAT